MESPHARDRHDNYVLSQRFCSLTRFLAKKYIYLRTKARLFLALQLKRTNWQNPKFCMNIIDSKYL